MTRNPEIGVMFRREQDPATLIASAKLAEELGYDQLWFVEDCFYSGGIAQVAMALAVTNHIKVGIGVNPAVGRNPAILAMEYATLARAFPERFIGGLGHGVQIWMDQIGEKVKSPLTSLEETTRAVHDLLHGQHLSREGRYVQLRDVVLDPPPSVAPPIVIGALREKSIQLAGKYADGMLIAENGGADYIRWARTLFDAGREDRGYFVAYAHAVIDDDSPDLAIKAMRKVVAANNANGVDVLTVQLPYADELDKLAKRGGAEALAADMPDAWIHDLAVAGSASQARDDISRLANAGADCIILVPLPEWDWEDWVRKSASVLR